jgi:hypothetical protein
MEWFEKLPEQCPPQEATVPNNETFYRIIKGNAVEDNDFLSQREIRGVDLVFHSKEITECIARAVSIYKTVDDATSLLKLPKFKNCEIAKVSLNIDDGLVLKTMRNSHYSWWRSKRFDINKANVYRNE